MQMISKGYFFLSSILVLVGGVIGWYLAKYSLPLLFPEGIDSVNFLYIFFGYGIPLALLNIAEVKYLWRRLLSANIDILGVSVGIIIGVLFFYRLEGW
ncbi:hypothetical protein [Cellvibrio sp. PSBB023]|uniref:hypothetical protein n=1 Tax=Cellvibrio sp. PSBB023 TaxID=1945512 RepID=UPI00098ED8A4|nr:hypothetical protein [Cellvibrio sp. PSBB023]AQT60929.1 hypothetical protein B0D95_13185 [Cellvibrio sp. PSBB023]